MTRKSKREVERALDDLGDGVDVDDPDLSDEQAAAIRAFGRWRRRTYPAGDGPTGRELFDEALEHLDDPHATELREVLTGDRRSA